MENNSKEMATIVETFVIEETQELIYDNNQLDSWNQIVNELGLIGQSKIKVQGKSPIPFMCINSTLFNTFKCLCPRAVLIENYDLTPIPLKILDLIKLSKREQYFNKIEIWYDEKTKDPFCIGATAEFTPISKGYKYHHDNKCKSSKEALQFLHDNNLEPYNSEGGYWINEKYYLLGKWADVKRSFEELKQMANKRYTDEKGIEYKKQIRDAQRGLEDLEIEAFEKFN
jgi:hypothetical protein